MHGGLSGLEFDFFLDLQDSSDGVAVGFPKLTGGRCDVPVHVFIHKQPDRNMGPHIVAELVARGETWVFANFRYERGDLVRMLKDVQRVSDETAFVADSSIVWNPRTVHGVEEPRCEGKQRRGYVDCRLSMMKRDGAGSRAIAFARALSAERGYFGYATGVSPHLFGPVAYVSTLASGVSTYGSGYLVTPDLRIIDPAGIDHDKQLRFRQNPVFRRMLLAHPQATVWWQAGVGGEQRRPGGGQRFVVTRPIVDGCHACPLLGAARVAYDFDARGRFVGVKLIDVRAGRRAWFPR